MRKMSATCMPAAEGWHPARRYRKPRMAWARSIGVTRQASEVMVSTGTPVAIRALAAQRAGRAAENGGVSDGGVQLEEVRLEADRVQQRTAQLAGKGGQIRAEAVGEGLRRQDVLVGRHDGGDLVHRPAGDGAAGLVPAVAQIADPLARPRGQRAVLQMRLESGEGSPVDCRGGYPFASAEAGKAGDA